MSVWVYKYDYNPTCFKLMFIIHTNSKKNLYIGLNLNQHKLNQKLIKKKNTDK